MATTAPTTATPAPVPDALGDRRIAPSVGADAAAPPRPDLAPEELARRSVAADLTPRERQIAYLDVAVRRSPTAIARTFHVPVATAVRRVHDIRRRLAASDADGAPHADVADGLALAG